MKSFIKTFGTFNEPTDWKEETKLHIIDLLKNALREELNAWYGYTIVREHLAGSFRPDVVKLYDELAEDELKDHGYWLMKRINELGGTIEDITISPNSWGEAIHKFRSPLWSNTGENMLIISVKESLKTNIENEKDAISTYNELINITQGIDWTTNSKCKSILADEEEHLQMLQDFIDDINSDNHCSCNDPCCTPPCCNTDDTCPIEPEPIDSTDISIENDEITKTEI